MQALLCQGTLLLGKYMVERVLGQGGMGLVVAARHVDLDEMFAIKMLLPDALGQAGAVNRFLREARAVARLKGEHVVRVYDVARLENGAPCMVMEYLEGTDLKALLGARGPLPAAQAVAYLVEVCDGIREAHAAGIIHRDLKPANLFLARRSNGQPRMKVLDFGIVKELSSDATDLTRTGEVVGTSYYMSPEQIARTTDVDGRCDVWALGVVLYELTTGIRPFQADTATAVVARVLQSEPAPPSQVRPGLPRVLDEVVRRCLEKQPELRFQTMEALQSALIGLARAGVADGAGHWMPVDLGERATPAESGTVLRPPSAPEPRIEAKPRPRRARTGGATRRRSSSFKRFDVLGQSAMALIAAMGPFRSIAEKALASHHIHSMAADGWYPLGPFLKSFHRIERSAGKFTLFVVGKSVPEHAVFPPGIDSIELGLGSIDIAYHLNHRRDGKVMFDPETETMLDGIGHYAYIREGDRRCVLVSDTPYPSEFDEGIVTAIAQRFEPHARVELDPSKPTRRSGGGSCTFVVTW